MNRRGFTLIELLVVIAVISLLIAIMVPVLHGARESSKAVLCSSRIRDLGISLINHEMNNGAFPPGFDDLNHQGKPPPGGFLMNSVYDKMGWWWFHHIMEPTTSFRRTPTLRCPSRNIRDTTAFENVLLGNYGVNQAICRNARGVREAEYVGLPLSSATIPRPSETPLIADSGYSTITWWHATENPPVVLGASGEDMAYVPGLSINSSRNLRPGTENDALFGRHPNRSVNVCFVDGHVKRMSAEQLYVEPVESGYQSHLPLWGPQDQ